jgi:hypothetical protein
MSVQRTDTYAFEGLPLSSIAAGTTLLVTGPGQLASKLARRLVLAGRNTNEGMLFISTNTTGRNLAASCVGQYPDMDASRLGIVDATGRANVETETDARMAEVSSTGDLTGISIRFSTLYSALYEDGIERIRTCFDSLSILLLYTNAETITRFVHSIDGRVSTADGLGIFVLDPSMHDERVVYTLQHLCDGRIEVQRGGERGQLRVQGLPDQPEAWTDVDL